MRTLFFLILALCFNAPSAFAENEGFIRLTPDKLQWQESPFPGLFFVVIAGNPQEKGFYMIRGRFTSGAFSPPHFHSTDRHVTVLEGTWWTGEGPDFDIENTIPLGPGSYMKHPAGAVHFDGAKDEEVIVEIKGMGPVLTTRVDTKK